MVDPSCHWKVLERISLTAGILPTTRKDDLVRDFMSFLQKWDNSQRVALKEGRIYLVKSFSFDKRTDRLKHLSWSWSSCLLAGWLGDHPDLQKSPSPPAGPVTHSGAGGMRASSPWKPWLGKHSKANMGIILN